MIRVPYRPVQKLKTIGVYRRHSLPPDTEDDPTYKKDGEPRDGERGTAKQAISENLPCARRVRYLPTIQRSHFRSRKRAGRVNISCRFSLAKGHETCLSAFMSAS